jgi:hypothetical protein
MKQPRLPSAIIRQQQYDALAKIIMAIPKEVYDCFAGRYELAKYISQLGREKT